MTLVGKRIAHYEVLQLIDSGGMGDVYRARDTRLGREVAIKFLTSHAADDPVALKRFIGEARLASALNHPNIITLYEIGESEEGHYLVTELIHGRTLKQIMAEGRPSAAESVNLIAQAAEGLAKAHEAGIVHRDVKPANLMVTGDGLVKILDFGLAKLHGDADFTDGEPSMDLTRTGTVVGTMAYLPPERLFGAAADARSDVFSLAVVAHELLYGRHPFLRDSVSSTLKAIVHDDPPCPSEADEPIPQELADVLRKAMSKEPSDRFPTAREFSQALRLWSTLLPHGRAPRPEDSRARRRWRRWLVAAGALVLLGAAFASWPRIRSPHPSTPWQDDLRVAVLPASDQTGDRDLTEARIDRILADVFVHVLSDMDDVYVVSPLRLEGIARTRGRSVEDAARDFDFARELCEAAEATAVLRSTLSYVAGAYVLTATLTGVKQEDLLGTFQADSADPARLLSDMSAGMKTAIQHRFRPRDAAAAAATGLATSSMRAYSHYVKGRDYIGLAQWEQARQELEAAVEIDPHMAMAWSELGCAYSFLERDASLVERAQIEAERWAAGIPRKQRLWIELNGTWLRTANGTAYLEQLSHYLAEYPDDRDAYFYAGLAAQWLNGSCREALPWFEKAYELTPFYHPITKGLVDCHLELGQEDQAIAALERYLKLARPPAHGRTWAQDRLRALGNERPR